MSSDVQTPRSVQHRTVIRLAVGLILILLSCSILGRFRASTSIQYALWTFSGTALLGLFLLRSTPLKAEYILRRPHWVQILMHSTIFVYWGLYYDEVLNQVPLILAQVVMAYLLDILLSWWRRGKWVLGMGPVPVVGSINLFLWFRDDYWHWQVVMLVIAMASKPFLRWTRDGRNTHIFNPSAIALGVVSLFVILAGQSATETMTWGVDIAKNLNNPEHIYACMFLVGFVVQVLFQTTLTTAAAAVFVWCFSFYWGQDHTPLFVQTYIPIAVFLGMNLLITDPTTSPNSKSGRVFFGMSYGLGVVLLWWGLEYIGHPTFYDKLLQVPVLNLMVPIFERMGRWCDDRGSGIPLIGDNLIHVGAWALAFVFMLPTLRVEGFQQEHQKLQAKFVSKETADSDVYRQQQADSIAKDAFGSGMMFLEGKDGTPKDYLKAATAFNHACEENSLQHSGVACYYLGELYLDGRLDSTPGQSKPNPRVASEKFQRACSMKYGPACGHLGTMYLSGEGIGKDPARGRALLKESCQLGVEPACELLTNAETPGGIDESACDRGVADACARLAGQYFTGANGVPRDLSKAATYAQKACDGGIAPLCGNLGGMYLEGNGVPQDPVKAKALFQKACQGGEARACEFHKQLP